MGVIYQLMRGSNHGYTVDQFVNSRPSTIRQIKRHGIIQCDDFCQHIICVPNMLSYRIVYESVFKYRAPVG